MLWKKGRRKCEGVGAVLKILLNKDLEEVREKVIANIWERVLCIERTAGRTSRRLFACCIWIRARSSMYMKCSEEEAEWEGLRSIGYKEPGYKVVKAIVSTLTFTLNDFGSQ